MTYIFMMILLQVLEFHAPPSRERYIFEGQAHLLPHAWPSEAECFPWRDAVLTEVSPSARKVEMEIAMNSYPALDSWEMVDGIDASDAAASEGQFSWGSGAATPARQPDSNPSPEDSSGSRPPSAHDGGNINGARCVFASLRTEPAASVVMP